MSGDRKVESRIALYVPADAISFSRILSAIADVLGDGTMIRNRAGGYEIIPPDQGERQP